MGVARVATKAKRPISTKVALAPEALAEHASRHLENRVPNDERLLDVANLELTEAEIRHHGRGRHGDGLLLNVSEKAEPEKKGKDAPANAQGGSGVQRHFPAGSSGLGFGSGLLLCSPASSINCLRT